jgi:hypothetical protein
VGDTPQQKEEPLMGSVLRLVRDRKKSKRMGEVQIVDREAYSPAQLDREERLSD